MGLKSIFWFASGLFCLATGVVAAQTKQTGTVAPSAGTIATINGVSIGQAQLDRVVANAVAQGQRDTAELRQALKDELIAREVLAQEALRLKLDRTGDAASLLAAARQSVLIDLLFADHLAKNPISESEIVAEYKRQIRDFEERGGNQQYRLRQVSVASETEARSIIARIRKGESMEAIARLSSIAPNKEQGGLLDWLSPLQMLPAVSSVVVNLSAGTLAAAPILTQDAWSVVRVEEVRPFQPPSLEQLRDQLRVALIRERQGALVRKLRASAQISD